MKLYRRMEFLRPTAFPLVGGTQAERQYALEAAVRMTHSSQSLTAATTPVRIYGCLHTKTPSDSPCPGASGASRAIGPAQT